METATSLISNLFKGSPHIGKCEVCGNEYGQCMEIRLYGENHTFDCFECAIHALAPHCVHCGCQVIGHGVETNGLLYCSTHCARQNENRDLDKTRELERSNI